MNGTLVTAEDRNFVRLNYGSMTAGEIAAAIGRPKSTIWRIAQQLGVRKCHRHPEELVGKIAHLHAEGLNDHEIARSLTLTRDQVKAVRADRLKLPNNCVGEKRRECGRRAVATQLARFGVANMGELRSLMHARFAQANGWPAELPPRAVQILNVLAAEGPQTAKALAEKLLLPAKTRAHRIPLRWSSGTGKARGKGGTYTAYLIRLGLVISMQRHTPTGPRGKCRLANLYMLGPAAIACLEQRAKEMNDAQCAEAG